MKVCAEYYCITGIFGKQKFAEFSYDDTLLMRKGLADLLLPKQVCIGRKHLEDYSLVKCSSFAKFAKHFPTYNDFPTIW